MKPTRFVNTAGSASPDDERKKRKIENNINEGVFTLKMPLFL